MSDDLVVERAKLSARILMAASDETCAALVKGINPSHVVEIIEKFDPATQERWYTLFDPATQERWYTLTEEAILAELRKSSEPRIPDERATEDSLIVLLDKLPQEEAERLVLILADPSKASGDELCWATRVAYEKLILLDEPYRSNLARALAIE